MLPVLKSHTLSVFVNCSSISNVVCIDLEMSSCDAILLQNKLCNCAHSSLPDDVVKPPLQYQSHQLMLYSFILMQIN